MKRGLLVLGCVFFLVAIAYPVSARGPGWGGGCHMMGYWGGGPDNCPWYGDRYNSLTAVQEEKLDQVSEAFYKGTTDLRNQIWNKSAELNGLLDAPEPDAAKIKGLQKEISDLKADLADKRLDYELELRKIVPDARVGTGYGRGGYARHMRGYGPGMTYGFRGCWN